MTNRNILPTLYIFTTSFQLDLDDDHDDENKKVVATHTIALSNRVVISILQCVRR